MKHHLRMRIDYLLLRLKCKMGCRDVLIAEIVKAYNSNPARRLADARIQGWTYIEPQS